ncbi:MAG: metallophosphoesterase [Clostridia bacterium]|nr:metallophosphoesterase [Clostridia bacterium]
MEKATIHEYVIPFKDIERKIIYHFSDSHLTEYDSLSSDEEIAKAKKMTEAWEGVRKGFCDAYGEEYGELQKQSPRTHFQNLIEASENGDALVLAGDTLDYVSGANVRLFDACMSGYRKPYIAVCGNHEPTKDIPDGFLYSSAKKPIQTIELDDMIIVGLENAKREIVREQLDALKTLLSGSKPLLIAMHVPIMTDGNRERLEKSGVYFQLNYDGCPDTNIELIELISNNAERIIAVLAGHLHYSDVSEVANGVTQYVTSQGITGNINRYIIGE